MRACILTLLLLAATAPSHAQRLLDLNINSVTDFEYAPFLVSGTGGYDTLFFTSSRKVEGRGGYRSGMRCEIFFSTRASRPGLSAAEGWGPAQRIATDDRYVDRFERGSQTLHGGTMVMAVERSRVQDSGEVFGKVPAFDIWEMRRAPNGFFTAPRPIAGINDPTAWDSQPTLSPDGSLLAFVSDRGVQEATGLNIWYSRRSPDGSWSAPLPAIGINTPGNDVTPAFGPDGRLYFASDWKDTGRGDFDIYVAELRTDGSGLELANRINIDSDPQRADGTIASILPTERTVNSSANDWYPFFSADRRAMFFSSNRAGGHGAYDIYAFDAPTYRILLRVPVTEVVLGADGKIQSGPRPAVATVTVMNERGGQVYAGSDGTYELEPGGQYTVTVVAGSEEKCYRMQLRPAGPQRVRAVAAVGRDTTIVLPYTLTRTQVGGIDPVVFNAAVVPYFITGYWWPNTTANYRVFEQRQREDYFARSTFIDARDYDAFGGYRSVTARIDRLFEDSLFKRIDSLLPLLSSECGDELAIKLTIHGFTDPSPIESELDIYPDRTVRVGVDDEGIATTIPTGTGMRQWEEANFTTGTQSGNITLSKLRAYYTYETFRDIMNTRPGYERLMENDRIVFDYEGWGIDAEGHAQRLADKRKYNAEQQRQLGLDKVIGTNDPYSRKIVVYVDVLPRKMLTTHRRGRAGELVGR